MLHQKWFQPIACHLVQDFWENLHTRNYSPLLLNMLWESLEIWPFFFIHIHMNPITTNPKGYRNSRWLTPNSLNKNQIFQIAVLVFASYCNEPYIETAVVSMQRSGHKQSQNWWCKIFAKCVCQSLYKGTNFRTVLWNTVVILIVLPTYLLIYKKIIISI